jgi:hypothetical protein
MRVYPDDWRVRLTTAVLVGACMAAAMKFGPAVGIHGFWPGGLSVIVSILVGVLLGNRVGRLLFAPASADPQDRPPSD